MQTIQHILLDKAARSALIDDCVKLIDSEVKKKGGLSGVAIKVGYKVVNGFKPGFVREATEGLIDSFAERLQPFVNEACEKKLRIGDYFGTERSRVADALLGITDDRAKQSSHRIVNEAYEKLRPVAKKHVEEAASGVGKLIENHIGD